MTIGRRIRKDATARTVGAMAGFILSAAAVIYLDVRARPRAGTPSPVKPRTVAAVHARTPAQANNDLGVRAAEQAAEIARLKLIIEGEHAMELLTQKTPMLDPARPEVARFSDMSPDERHAEIRMAATDVESYSDEGGFAPDVHSRLYERVNTLWDIRRLSDDENAWLRQSVHVLNEMAVQHALDAYDKGDDAVVVRTAESFGPWAFRLSDDEKRRMTTALRETVGRLRSAM